MSDRIIADKKEGAASVYGSTPCQFQAGSPVSRILYIPACAGISPPFIWAGRHRPALAAYPFRLLRCLGIHAGRMMRVNAFHESVCPDRNIFGLATHKVYPPAMSPQRTVGSYPTFSPLPRF